MIILNVSSYKTGGTWLHNILRAGTTQFKILKTPKLLELINKPDDYICKVPAHCASEDNSKKINLAISYSKLNTPLNILDKIHIYAESESMVEYFSSLDLCFIMMIRDYRDVIVSRYFHEIASDRFKGPFSEFFEGSAKKVLREAYLYNQFWLNVKNRQVAKVHIVNFADLKTNYTDEISNIQLFLGQYAFNVDAVKELNSIENNRNKFTEEWMESFKKAGGDFYRKGEIDDYKNYFSEAQLNTFNVWLKEMPVDGN